MEDSRAVHVQGNLNVTITQLIWLQCAHAYIFFRPQVSDGHMCSKSGLPKPIQLSSDSEAPPSALHSTQVSVRLLPWDVGKGKRRQREAAPPGWRGPAGARARLPSGRRLVPWPSPRVRCSCK